jgi:hypothetical protein
VANITRKTKNTETSQKLAKSGDTLDMAPIVKEFKETERMSYAEMKAAIAEIDAVQNTPDMPKRWGDKGERLTIATPGTMVDDPTYIPEYVRTRDGFKRHVTNHRVIDGHMHILTPDSQEKLRWCRDDGRKIPLHQRRGFTYVKYSKTFADTGLFQEGPGDTVKNGDLILMKIYLDGWERMRKEKNNLQSLLEGAAGQELFQTGESTGTPTFKDNLETGVREFYT